MTATITGLLSEHWAELQASGIAADVAAANVASFGPGTDRHWEVEREELTRHQRHEIQTGSVTGRGLPQTQPGHLADRLIRLDQQYRHLAGGGWRTLSATLPGLPAFDQWKPATPRPKGKRDRHGNWKASVDALGRPEGQKYETPPAFPEGGGLLLPNVPDRCWELICDRQGLSFPDAGIRAAGFWSWAAATPDLEVLITEGFKKALAAVSAGYAAVAVPGVSMGIRGSGKAARRLIAALQALAAPRRRWRIAFDADAKLSTAANVAAAAGALAQTLRAAGGQVAIARLPLLPGTDKTGLDDLLAADGPEALDRALADVSPQPVLPQAPRPHRVAPAGQYLGQACPIPSPDEAPLVVIRAPMGCGKTVAVADALRPLQQAGVQLLMPSHRKAQGQASAESIGVPWCPVHGSDERLLGVAGCWDSWCPESALRISPTGWSGGVMVLDEWMQAIEHLLMSTGTTLGKRLRASVLRTAAEQLPRLRQTIAMDAQMAEWGVRLLERLTGHRALVIDSKHQPMAGRPLHCLEGFKTPQAAAEAFRAQWAELMEAGEPFFCWTSAQKADVANSPQRLAALHRQRVPGAKVLVIDSTTPEAAARLAADPDGEAAGWDAIYASPSVSSGISFQSWRPAAVIAYAGGHIAAEHVAQALARVRCREVPGYLFAPERAPGAALRVGSGATDPARLIADLRAVSNPLYGELEPIAGGAFLEAWAELGAHRNRQRFGYRATIAGLLEAEGWAPQAPGPAPCPVAGAQVGADLKAAALSAREAMDAAVIHAELLTPAAASVLDRRRQRTADEQAALDRYRLGKHWGLGSAAPSLELLEADRDGLRDRLKLGWLLTTPEALALVPQHDQQRIDALDPEGRPFEPDRLRVTLGSKIAALQALGVPQLLERFAAGETIAATDPAVIALHAAATAHSGQLAAAAGLSPRKLASGTLRALLQACGWELVKAGRVKARGADRDALMYRAAPVALPEEVDPGALAAVWLAELTFGTGGALFVPIGKSCRAQKCPTPPEPLVPDRIWRHLMARSVALPWIPRPRAAPQAARRCGIGLMNPSSTALLDDIKSRYGKTKNSDCMSGAGF